MIWTRRQWLFSLSGAAAAAPPYVDRTQERAEFSDAAEAPPPPGLREVRIGYFGPEDRLFQAAAEEVQRANGGGGWQGMPFRLCQRWTADPWRAAAGLVVELAYREQVWAVLAAAGSDSVHLAAQVAVKARLPLLDALSTDRTVSAAMTPWVFSLLPDDAAIAAAVGNSVLASEPGATFTLVSATSHGERLLAGEFLRFLRQRRAAPRRHLQFHPGAAVELEGQRVLLVASWEDTLRLAPQFAGRELFCGPAAARAEFLRGAGTAAEGIRYPVLVRPPAGMDYAESQTRDGVRLLVAAIRKGGLSRNGIRLALAGLSPWPGIAGSITWSALQRNQSPVACGTLRRANEWELSLTKES